MVRDWLQWCDVVGDANALVAVNALALIARGNRNRNRSCRCSDSMLITGSDSRGRTQPKTLDQALVLGVWLVRITRAKGKMAWFWSTMPYRLD